MSKKLKKWMASEVRRDVGGATACVVLGCGSLPGEGSSALRAQLRKAKVHLTVVRNRVTVHALAGTALADIKPLIKGPTAVATGGEDAASLAKAVVEGVKGRKGFECRGGFVEGRVVTGAEIQHLATLPSKKELLAMIAATVAAPMTNIAYGIDALLSGTARAVNALAEKRQSEEAAAGAAAEAPQSGNA
jgi:large subunit ribosomal protein L10